MIIFDLKCGGGHVFEAWFGSSDDYADQKERGLVSCPVCNSSAVEKAVMAPAIGAKSNTKQTSVVPAPKQTAPGQPVPMHQSEPDPAKMKALLGKLAKEQARMLEKSDYVGGDFAKEARDMHDGVSDGRSIHGETTIEEAKSLIEDGVPVAPLPLPVRPPKSDN